VEGPALELIPAIDLRSGRAVRLTEGRFEEETDFGDPVAAARRWAGEGASRLHVVDLDGARLGRLVQTEVVRAISAAARVPIQVGGGLRDDAAVQAAFEGGADRVVLGTGLLRDPGWAARLVQRHGPTRIVAALDARAGQAVGDGWVEGGAASPLGQATEQLAGAGIELFVVTAIDRDGTLEGPDLDLLRQVADQVGPEHVVASGGIASVADLQALATAGYAGAILGRALYEDRIDLREARSAIPGG
jgi:phosphoribosylformimino-5-aminoimidazole carboxamide ribotide isomerase